MIASQRQLRNYANELEVANKDLEEFAYIASHDLRSPLRGIGQLSQFIREDDDRILSDGSRENLDRLEKRVDRMQTLLDDLLTYSRIGRREGKLEEIDLDVLVRDMIDLLGVPSGFRIELPSKLPVMTSYATPLRMIFMNLIGNAVKHHHRNDGVIALSCDENDANEYRFSISDDGPGIDAAYHQKVFKMFQTLQSRDKVEASGMGLAIVQKTLQRFGGQIEIESELGTGTTFHFTWPKTHETIVEEPMAGAMNE